MERHTFTAAFLMSFLLLTLASIAKAQEPQWLDTYEFNQETLASNGWAEIPGGFESREPGVTQFRDLPDQAIASSIDGRGIAITVKPKQVTFLYALNPIATNGRPILIRMTARASSPWASIALIALRGDISTGKDLDGSIGLNNPAISESFVDKERRIVLVYEPDKGDIFTLAIQVAGTGALSAATVWIDKVEMLSLDPDQFGADSISLIPTPTYTPMPEPTPTNTPQPSSGNTITINLNMPSGAKPLEMVLIPAGTFTMGSPLNEQNRDPDEAQHQVTLTKDFYIGKYEVTQAQWQAVMGSNPSRSFGIGSNYPVYNVSWNDCQTFITKLNQIGQGTFRLPTEAEWEYACRAGTTTAFYWGNSDSDSIMKDNCWYDQNAREWTWTLPHANKEGTQQVGTKLPNAWGLHNMSGNVWEWCQDRSGLYPSESVVDPIGQVSGSYRVRRGGCWDDDAWYCRSAYRGRDNPGYTNNSMGFRVVSSRTN